MFTLDGNPLPSPTRMEMWWEVGERKLILEWGFLLDEEHFDLLTKTRSLEVLVLHYPERTHPEGIATHNVKIVSVSGASSPRSARGGRLWEDFRVEMLVIDK